VAKAFIFISCGQFTEAEKSLGRSIVAVVRRITGLEAFFAEDVHDLNGLDSNILESLRDATGFITVLHPRGTIQRPDRSVHVRASVWIEQEIAIATYIQRVEKKRLPVIAFIHSSVGREGLRDLLHLNPITFTSESDVVARLPELLQPWRDLAPAGITVKLESGDTVLKDGHATRQLRVILTNDTNERLTKFNGVVRLPMGILKHWSARYPFERKTNDPKFRVFGVDEEGRAPIWPHSSEVVLTMDYCPKCGADDLGDDPLNCGDGDLGNGN